MKTPRIPVALEGYPFIIFSAFFTLVFAILQCTIPSILGLILTSFTCWFFRDPSRTAPLEKAALIAPADGKIILIEKIMDDKFQLGNVIKVSIFMNVFNVHVNRIPFSGLVEKVSFKPGRFYSADSDRGALHNEYCAMIIQIATGQRFGVVQVAGLIARRIICWAEKNDTVVAGQRFGLIRFGSRVDLYLPPETNIKVVKGQKVTAGETLLGILTQQ